MILNCGGCYDFIFVEVCLLKSRSYQPRLGESSMVARRQGGPIWCLWVRSHVEWPCWSMHGFFIGVASGSGRQGEKNASKHKACLQGIKSIWSHFTLWSFATWQSQWKCQKTPYSVVLFVFKGTSDQQSSLGLFYKSRIKAPRCKNKDLFLSPGSNENNNQKSLTGLRAASKSGEVKPKDSSLWNVTWDHMSEERRHFSVPLGQ